MKAKQREIAEGILFTDQYQLTMAQLYFRMGLHEKTVQFEHFFRVYPNYGSHQAGYCINAGLEWLLDWMEESRFGKEEIAFLEGQRSISGKPLFERDFLKWLHKHGTFQALAIRAIPEGRVVHAYVPLTVVQGPLAMAQILESPLLNHLNYQTLIATKAARIREAAGSGMLLEFGLRRAQGTGATAGARAALIGGAHFSSNVGLSHALGYPPKGTHAHSMVQLFMARGEGELGAFRAYAGLYPDDCLLLVDTVNTLESGIPHAITVFNELRRKGHKPLGIRLDSGDLAYLCIQAAKMLNDAHFSDTVIVLSNQLDELVIWQIITQIRKEAGRYGVDPDHLIKRLMFGVGTNLVTSRGYSALDGVYKLSAVKDADTWIPTIKVSEAKEKTINPGNKQVWRIYDTGEKAIADLIALADETPQRSSELILRHPTEGAKKRVLKKDDISTMESLLTTVVAHGKRVAGAPSIDEMRRERDRDLERLYPGVKRLMNPHIYHVSLTQELWDLKQKLIANEQNRVPSA